MGDFDIVNMFQGISTFFSAPILISIGRIFLICLGGLLVYLGRKEILEPLLMIPMGLGMAAINAGVLILDNGAHGTLFMNPMISDYNELLTVLQIDFLQPVFTYTFSNGLIACVVFMGIGTLLDVGFLLARPFTSMFIALCAELGTILTFPIAVWMGLSPNDAASIAMVGGADGPMVLFASLMLSKNLFIPITVVAYLYLGLTYGGYPYLIKLMVPKELRAIKMPPPKKVLVITSNEKLAFSFVTCVVLCLLFPVAAPLFFSLFLGVAIRESGINHYISLVSGPMLYTATLFLGILLGVLCEASIILNPAVFKLLVLGILALLLSGIGGILGGYIMFFITKGKFNPVIGIAGVSCVPTTAKVAQKSVFKENPNSIVMPDALGANISGVITSAIIAAIFVTLLK
ncbi:MAG TPA: sodium ion-translocating decarboxylase subunit beta [Candidatus Kapabacteria bacterium]|jgi:oxaloacetate decarboxylase beta subunit|nr:sodium ion-translocating decarboxylase subunit beta [Candidatus Kapabacteria bacterium]HPP39281.1 sodium ion-translocating decarboxylase subunit beta [Candidatus Kapabacteria bacterium]